MCMCMCYTKYAKYYEFNADSYVIKHMQKYWIKKCIQNMK